jgi:hypothetical protein
MKLSSSPACPSSWACGPGWADAAQAASAAKKNVAARIEEEIIATPDDMKFVAVRLFYNAMPGIASTGDRVSTRRKAFPRTRSAGKRGSYFPLAEKSTRRKIPKSSRKVTSHAKLF